MPDVLAIIPARVGSKGIPGKNTRLLAGRSPLNRAIDTVKEAHVQQFAVSSDFPWERNERYMGFDAHLRYGLWLYAPAPLHTDDCPMIDVVKDVLARVDGPEDQIVLLVQPSQPLRQPRHLRDAVALLEATHADSVVSVVQLPATHHPQWQARIVAGRLEHSWTAAATRRQDLPPVYIRDGTTYCFRRSTVSRHGNIYGNDCRPLIIPASESCALDTEEDWREAERRIREREAVSGVR